MLVIRDVSRVSHQLRRSELKKGEAQRAEHQSNREVNECSE